jgi:hypothetical protein
VTLKPNFEARNSIISYSFSQTINHHTERGPVEIAC